jgi:hypothetical protein
MPRSSAARFYPLSAELSSVKRDIAIHSATLRTGFADLGQAETFSELVNDEHPAAEDAWRFHRDAV